MTLPTKLERPIGRAVHLIKTFRREGGNVHLGRFADGQAPRCIELDAKEAS